MSAITIRVAIPLTVDQRRTLERHVGRLLGQHAANEWAEELIRQRIELLAALHMDEDVRREVRRGQ